jgi:hypothetical protein
MYLVTMPGNLVIILAVSFYSHLHTPNVLLPLQPVLDWRLQSLPLSPDGVDILNILIKTRVNSCGYCLTQMSLILTFVCLYGWMLCFWLWWPMVGMWPSVTSCIAKSLWVFLVLASFLQFFWISAAQFDYLTNYHI